MNDKRKPNADDTSAPQNPAEQVHQRKNHTPNGLNDVRNPKSQQPNEPTAQHNQVIRQPRS